MTNHTEHPGATPSPAWVRALRAIGLTIMWFVLALMTLWAIAALYVDFRMAALRIPLTVIYALAIVAILIKVRPKVWAAALCLVGFCIVLAWWLSLKPSNEGDWQPDAARTASVEINGDRVTIHNLRNCDYITKTDYSNCWSDRVVYLSQLRYADLFFTTWGPKYIGHPIRQLSVRGQRPHRVLDRGALQGRSGLLGDSGILPAVRAGLHHGRRARRDSLAH